MKTTLKLLTLLILPLLCFNCGGKEEKKKETFSYEKKAPSKDTTTPDATEIPASKKVDLVNKGIGPITSVELAPEINESMVIRGTEIFNSKCTACHRPDKKFVGPAPAGIMKTRTPEWVMNMILNPEVMVKEDPLAKALLIEFNGAPMINQNLTQEEARDVLEYFRTLN